MRHQFSAAVAAAAACLAASPAASQEPAGAGVTVGLGAAFAPDYFGAGTSGLAPAGALSVQRIVLPGGFGIGTDSALPTDPGIGPRGAFRYIPAREASENAGLAGLDDVDRSVEVGLGLFSITERSRTFAEVRKGIGGHSGWVAEAGVDAVLRPTQRLVLTVGPRANWGDEDFVDTYFGVTADEAARSAYAAFNADGGLVSLGVEMNVRYDFGSGWGLHGTLGWRELQGDAGRSPVTEAGSRDQFGARLIFTRSFDMGF